MFLLHACLLPRMRLLHACPHTQRACSAASFACLLANSNERESDEAVHLFRFAFCCTGRRERSMTLFKVVLDVDGVLTFRGAEEGQGRFEHARHDAGAPHPAPPPARDRQLGRRSPCAYPRPPQIVDLSASDAHAPSLILQPPTVCASLTPLQAQIRRARPRAAIAMPSGGDASMDRL